MENNEIINNDEVIEKATEIVKTTSNNGFSKVGSVGLGIIIGALASKYVLQPAGLKIKTWREERKAKKHGYVNADYREVDNVDAEAEDED